jgi:Kef-type K+ transport system membrane component KefB
MQDAATPLSNLSFQLFFSAVGMSANLGYALQTGPASVWFSGIAIVTHIILTLGLCRCYSGGWGSWSRSSIMEEKEWNWW